MAGQTDARPVQDSNFNALYFSIVTFTTIGYGDYAPLGGLRWVAGAEGFLGLFLMAVLTFPWPESSFVSPVALVAQRDRPDSVEYARIRGGAEKRKS